MPKPEVYSIISVYADSQLAGSLGSLGYAYYADGALAEAADTVGSTSRSYEWDYNADGSLDLSPNGTPLVQYVWGLLGPVARVDLQNGSNTRYYVLDARGRARALVDSTGSVTDYYEAWGNVLPGSFGSRGRSPSRKVFYAVGLVSGSGLEPVRMGLTPP